MDSSEAQGPLGDPQMAIPPNLRTKYFNQSQLDFELAFFEGILARDPNYVDVLRVTGNNLTTKGEYRKSLEIDRRIARLCPGDRVAHYNLACSYSLCSMVEPALNALQLAIEFGYDEFDYILEDRDLELIRKDPRFRDLLESYGVV